MVPRKHVHLCLAQEGKLISPANDSLSLPAITAPGLTPTFRVLQRGSKSPAPLIFSPNLSRTLAIQYPKFHQPATQAPQGKGSAKGEMPFSPSCKTLTVHEIFSWSFFSWLGHEPPSLSCTKKGGKWTNSIKLMLVNLFLSFSSVVFKAW